MIMVISPSKRWLDELAKQRKVDERAAAVAAPAAEVAVEAPTEVEAPIQPPIELEVAEAAPASDDTP